MNIFSNRIEKLRSLLLENEIESFLITGKANVAYFTGTKGDDLILYITQNEAFIITDFRYRELAQSLESSFKYFEIGINNRLLGFLKDRKERLIGIERNQMPLNIYLELTQNLKNHSFKPVSGLIEQLRMIKDDFEIESTQKAADIASKAFDHMLSILKPGLSELEAAAELEYFMRKEGSEGTSFDTILITGAKTSLPHGVPGHEIIKEGDFVTMDFGCKVNGYCSDMTRTVGIGYLSDEQKQVYQIVLDAQNNALTHIKPGISGDTAHHFALDIIEKAGYGAYFGHGLSHGTGLEIHEAPRNSIGSKDILQVGEIISVEPGIYLPKRFGVRIEDLVLVAKNGIINFVNAPKELIIL